MHRPLKMAALSAAAHLLLAAAANAQAPIIAETDPWDVLHPTNGADPAANDADFATTWYAFDGNYDGPAFTPNKAGPFSYGGIAYWGDTGTFIGVDGTAAAPPAGQRYTAYFKKQFTTTEDFTNMHLVMLADDGAVIYIDGEERRRVNMTGTVPGRANGTGDTYTMLADRGLADETVLSAPISLGALSAGTHTIAISLHNSDNTASSDLGLFVRLYSSLPPLPLVKTTLGGVSSDIAAVPGFTGWGPGETYAFSVSGVPGTHVLHSQPIDLQSTGQAYFAMEIYCYEGSAGTNFEDTDEFSAKLLYIFDNDTQAEVSLLPADLDLNQDKKLTGDEFNPGLLPATASVVVGRQLYAIIPPEVKTVTLQITGMNDSATEAYRIGGAMIGDVPLDTDTDGDGVNLAAELFSGTNPADAASRLRTLEASYEFATDLDPDPDAWIFNNKFPAVAGKIYAVESSADGGASWELDGFVTPDTTGDFTVYVDFALAPPPRYVQRLRCVP
jgi:hypothetical protein